MTGAGRTCCRCISPLPGLNVSPVERKSLRLLEWDVATGGESLSSTSGHSKSGAMIVNETRFAATQFYYSSVDTGRRDRAADCVAMASGPADGAVRISSEPRTARSDDGASSRRSAAYVAYSATTGYPPGALRGERGSI
jgi:hypothetical protein